MNHPQPDAERSRLAEADARRALAALGPVPERAPVGHRARGLQPRRQRLGLLHPRPGALARLPLGRGRPRRHLRRQAAPVLRAGAVERQRPDPQGAAVRPHQQRGQPRRGRQGVLLLPRLARRRTRTCGTSTSTRRRRSPTTTSSRPTAARSRPSSSTSCSTPASSTSDRYFDVFVEYAKASPEDMLIRITVSQPRPGAGDAARAADALVPQHLVVAGRHAARARRSARSAGRARHASVVARRHARARASACSTRGRRAAAVHRERDQHRSGSSDEPNAHALRQGRHQRLRRPRRAERGQPRRDGTKAAAHYWLTVPAGGEVTCSACGSRPRARRRCGGTRSATFDAIFAARRAEADEFYRVDHAARA